MKKLAQILESDVDSLINKLLGDVSVHSSEGVTSTEKDERYQLPVKHTKGGAEIDDKNKPWIVGTFIPGQYINETHPQGHNGVDLKAPLGTPIYPIASGEVIEAREYGKGGKTVKVSHEDGKVVSYYAHLDSVSVAPGQAVTQSTVLGEMGDTGNAKGRGAHLHYEVKVSNNRVDPQSIIGKRVGSLSKKAEFIANIVKALDKIADRKENLQYLVKAAKS
jgi:murein DD-endopeptidase MepM/ murein hydrolase activator NlpD